MKTLPGLIRYFNADPPPAPPPDPIPPSDPPKEPSLLGKPADPPVDPPKDPVDPPKDPPKEPPKEVVPLTKEQLVIPEGFEAHEELTTKFLEAVNDATLSPVDRANKLIALQTDVMRLASERNSELWQKTQTDWRKEAEALPEIGGQKLPETLAGIRKMLDTYGSPELDQVLDLTGAGNNPHVISLLHKIAVELGEGKPLPPANPADAAADVASRLFPNQGK